VYGILRMINFAHGEVFMAGAFGSYFFANAWKDSGFMDDRTWLSLVLLVLIAMGVSVVVAVLLERIAYRPLRGAPRLVPLITAIGASLFLQNTFRGLFGSQTKGYPKPTALDGTWTILGIPIQKVQVIVLVVAAVAMIALTLFVSRTKTGKSMRAAAEDRRGEGGDAGREAHEVADVAEGEREEDARDAGEHPTDDERGHDHAIHAGQRVALAQPDRVASRRERERPGVEREGHTGASSSVDAGPLPVRAPRSFGYVVDVLGAAVGLHVK